MKKLADIGRTVSKLIKLAVSGKDSQVSEYHSVEILKFEKKQSVDPTITNMNHMINRDGANNEIEDMDTHEG